MWMYSSSVEMKINLKPNKLSFFMDVRIAKQVGITENFMYIQTTAQEGIQYQRSIHPPWI